MIPHRISVKFFVSEPTAVDLTAIVPVFHRWIQSWDAAGLLIDVADYRHVYQGSGVRLVGHEADYSVDLGGGRPGLLYTRKRAMAGDLQAILRDVFRQALVACRRLQEEPGLASALVFRTDEAELTFLDRLRWPNTLEAFATLAAEIRPLLAALHPDLEVDVSLVHEDARRPLALRLSAPGAADLETQIRRLEG